MSTFTLTKKNRKFFAISFVSGFKSKLLIDENSEQLEIGKQYTIELNDDSVKSKYGTDYKFSINSKNSVEDQIDAGVVSLVSDYNTKLVAACKKLGGQWDSEAKAWIFSDLISDKIDALDEIYNSKKTAVEIVIKEDDYLWGDTYRPATLAGIPIAGGAKGRDGGCKIYEGVSFAEGGADSGGSRKNYGTRVQGGSVIRMYVPIKLIKEIEDRSEVKSIIML